MTVIIHLVGQLKSLFNNQPTISVEAGQTVHEFLITAHVIPEMVAGVVVNGDLQSKDYVLRDADDVNLLPHVSKGYVLCEIWNSRNMVEMGMGNEDTFHL